MVRIYGHKRDERYKILVEKPKRKRLLGRPGRRYEDSIRMDLKEIGWDGVD
jgi:hypothetical protein